MLVRYRSSRSSLFTYAATAYELAGPASASLAVARPSYQEHVARIPSFSKKAKSQTQGDKA